MAAEQAVLDRKGKIELAIERIGLLTDGDLNRMMGLLATDLNVRSRDAQLDIMRAEQFDNFDVLDKAEENLKRYNRYTLATVSIANILKLSRDHDGLMAAIIGWAKSHEVTS